MSTVASSLPHVSGRRRRTDRVMRAVLLIATLIALVPLVLIIYFLLEHGLKAWGGSFFTTDPNGNFFGNPGGIKSAILGTLEIIALATIISVPIGIGVALYLVEYGKQSLFANVVRYFIDVMTGVPSIVFGLFIYIVLVISHTGGASFAAWKGAIAVALLMLPIVARSSEVVLHARPRQPARGSARARRAALAGGAEGRAAHGAPGLVTGSLLAVARGMGETAPLLFTVGATFVTSYNLNAQMNNLPLQIYTDITNPRQAVIDRAWGAALTLVAIILILNLLARLVSRRSRMA